MFKRELVLRPNCLLTRRPIYLLTGPRSIFYFQSPWKALVKFLSQHGYKVFVFKLPFQAKSHRGVYLKARLQELKQSHIFCDAITFQELRPLLSQVQHSTLTVLSESHLASLPEKTFQILTYHNAFSISYSLHQVYLKLLNINTPSAAEVGHKIPPSTYDLILDHCIKLAELDFYDLDLNRQL